MARKDKLKNQEQSDQQPSEEKSKFLLPLLLGVLSLFLVGGLYFLFFSGKKLEANFSMDDAMEEVLTIERKGDVPQVHFVSSTEGATFFEWTIVGRGTNTDTTIYDESNFYFSFPQTGNYQIILEVRNDEDQIDRQEKLLKVSFSDAFKQGARQEIERLLNSIATTSSVAEQVDAATRLKELCTGDAVINISSDNQKSQTFTINDLLSNLKPEEKVQLKVADDLTFSRSGLVAIINIEEELTNPTSPSIVNDKDFDGVEDQLDDCPDEPGYPALKGCPDKDKDGVADKDDRCIDQAGDPNNFGCPNGVIAGKGGTASTTLPPPPNPNNNNNNNNNSKPNDSPPSIEKPIEIAPPAVLDSDGDGIADSEDYCPLRKGDLANKGCPVERKPAKISELSRLAGEINSINKKAEKEDVAEAERFVVEAILPQLSNELKGVIVTENGREGRVSRTGMEEYLTDKIFEDVKIEIERLIKDENGKFVEITLIEK